MHLTLGSFDSCRLVWRSRRSQRRLRLQLHLLKLPVGNDSNSRIRRTSPDWFFGSTALRFYGSTGPPIRHPSSQPSTCRTRTPADFCWPICWLSWGDLAVAPTTSRFKFVYLAFVYSLFRAHRSKLSKALRNWCICRRQSGEASGFLAESNGCVIARKRFPMLYK